MIYSHPVKTEHLSDAPTLARRVFEEQEEVKWVFVETLVSVPD